MTWWLINALEKSDTQAYKEYSDVTPKCKWNDVSFSTERMTSNGRHMVAVRGLWGVCPSLPNESVSLSTSEKAASQKQQQQLTPSSAFTLDPFTSSPVLHSIVCGQHLQLNTHINVHMGEKCNLKSKRTPQDADTNKSFNKTSSFESNVKCREQPWTAISLFGLTDCVTCILHLFFLNYCSLLDLSNAKSISYTEKTTIKTQMKCVILKSKDPVHALFFNITKRKKRS